MELFEHLPCPAMVLSSDLTIVRANPEACSLFSDHSFTSGSVALSSLCPLETVEELRDIVESLNNGDPVKRVLPMQAAGRQTISVAVSVSILPANELLFVVTGHTRDGSCVTGCRKMRILEEQYQRNPAGILLVNERMEMISYNRKFLEMWNIPLHIQQSRDDNESLQVVLDQVAEPGEFLRKVYALYEDPRQESTDEVRLKDGRVFYRYSFPVHTDEEYLGRIWYFLDISSLKAAQRKIVRQQKFQRAVLEHIHDGIVACNARGELTVFNRASREIHGRDLARLPCAEWSSYFRLFHKDGSPMKPEEIPLVRAFEGKEVINEEMVVRTGDGKNRELRASGQAMFDNEGNRLGAVISLHDITDLNAARAKLQYLACHDKLTGLANRRLFHDLLEQDLRRAARKKERTAVLFLDIDNFKQVNDRYGHNAGDELLSGIAATLRQRLRDSDILCRWGGDEFILALPEIGDGDAARRVADKIGAMMARSLTRRYADCNLGVSIGIALYPDHGGGPDILIRQADVAMYQAKRQGRNRACLATDPTPEEG